MSCQARVLGHKIALEGFHTTKSCSQMAKKRLILADEPYGCCNDCFKRYTTGTDWYGWMDGSYPPKAPVVGSQAFYMSHKGKVVVTLPVQKAPLGSCGTCWRTSFERSECQVCHIEVCRACASVSPCTEYRARQPDTAASPKGDKGDFCKKCVPRRLPVPVPEAETVAVPEAEAEPEPEAVAEAEHKPDPHVEALTVQLAKMTVKEATASTASTASTGPKAPKKSLDYPIRTDIAALSLDELKALHAPLVPWMKENQTKYPRLMIPYYNYRMKLESLMIQKK
jgi:hypothetical protein